VDITCIELTPYRMGGDKLILVPRTIIPIPEARDHLISIERKEIKRAEESKSTGQFRALWSAVGEAFNGLETGFHTTGNSGGDWITVPVGNSYVHYQWTWRKRLAVIEVALHFEWPEPDRNARAAERIRKHEAEIKRGVDLEFAIAPVGGKGYMEARFRVPFDGNVADAQVAKQAAETMRVLIERTHPMVREILKSEG
ncbi:MAG TPA: hypothetical protein VMV94_01495, partial [Phycisphaerae bacterium]|nr:hypothetical protein [Phycisphaerae bacterium]